MAINTVEAELREATGLKPKSNEDRADWLKRLANGVEEKVDDAGWEDLSAAAQKWVNAAADAIKTNEEKPEILDFDQDVLGAREGDDPLDVPPALKRDTPAKEERAKKAAAKHADEVRARDGKTAKPAASAAKGSGKAAKKSGGKKKSDIIRDMLLSPKGATAKELMNAVGWTKITVTGQARSAGIKLRMEKDGDGRADRFFGTKMSEKAAAAARDAKPEPKKVAPKKAAAKSKPVAKKAPPKTAKSKANGKAASA